MGQCKPKKGLLLLAGASQRSPVEEASPESTEALFALNVEGTLRLNRVLLPRLLAQADGGGHGCRIVVIGSMASQVLPSMPSRGHNPPPPPPGPLLMMGESTVICVC